jgi:metal-responsive CopG/Arc/MetJ family transcriptional regulator
MKSSFKHKVESFPPEKRRDMAGTSGVATLEKPKESKKVIIEFSEDLLERTEAAASELSTDRSKFIRRAVERALAALERRKLERELADAYTANAKLAVRISEEFSHVDGEDL